MRAIRAAAAALSQAGQGREVDAGSRPRVGSTEPELRIANRHPLGMGIRVALRDHLARPEADDGVAKDHHRAVGLVAGCGRLAFHTEGFGDETGAIG